jgi:hypothetical protein
MKQFLLPCVLLIFSSAFGQEPLIEEDFESYTVGDYIGVVSNLWTTWSGATGTNEDGQVSDEQANSGTQSLKIFGIASGGPMDIYLPLGLDGTAYEVSYNIYVPSGYSAYMNVQENLSPAVGWAFDIVFSGNGSIQLSIDQVDIAFGSYNLDEWTSVSLRMDPVNNLAEIFIGGEYLANIAFDGIIGGVNFFGFGDGSALGRYYIDDVVVVETEDVFAVIFGCTDSYSCNYDPSATIDDGSCDYISCAGCTTPVACNYDPSATIDDGSCEFICNGCTEVGACNYDPSANVDDNSCIYPDQYYDCFGNCINDSDGDGLCDESEILGCLDPDSCNYNLEATDDDGSCEYITCSGCTYEFACNYDPDATIADNDSCEFGTCPGCTDSTACNYNPTILEDDGSCIYPDQYYDCLGNCIIDSDGDGICDELELLGCTDPYSCNYNLEATDDDGYCLYAGDSCDDSDSDTMNDTYSDICECIGEVVIAGCMSENACNYNANANESDDSCLFVGDVCDDEDANTDDDVIQDDCECAGTPSTIVDELEALSALIYPNPATTHLTIDLGDLTGLNTTMKMYDSSGKLVFEKQSSSLTTIDVTGFAKGIYTLDLSTYDNVLRSQVVVE